MSCHGCVVWVICSLVLIAPAYGYVPSTDSCAAERDRAGDAPANMPWAHEYCEGSYDPVCGAPLFEQSIARDVMGRARSVQTKWGNPESGPLAARPPPWRGYEYNAAGWLTTVYEHAGVVDPVEPDFAPHRTTNANVSAFVAGHNMNAVDVH